MVFGIGSIRKKLYMAFDLQQVEKTCKKNFPVELFIKKSQILDMNTNVVFKL